MANFFTSRLFFISLVCVAVAATLPLYVSGYILGLLTVAFYFGVFAMAWAISATVSAVAGVVVAVVNGVSSGLSAYGIKVFPAAILGGLDSVGGAVLGGIIIGLLENVAQYVDSEYLHWGNLYEIAPFYVLIIILMTCAYPCARLR